MKSEFREEALKKRLSLNEGEVNSKSNLIFENLKKLKSFESATEILAYVDFRNEVKTREILDFIIKSGKKLILPMTITKTRDLKLFRINNPMSDLKSGTYGIFEPNPEICTEVDRKIVDFVIVPGVAFSENCYRMGYGGGYYDRFLSTLRIDTVSCALAFELQIYDDIPKNSHDAQIDFVITENRILGS